MLNVEGPLRSLPTSEREAALTGLLLGIDRGLGVGRDWPVLDGPVAGLRPGEEDQRLNSWSSSSVNGGSEPG